MPAVAVCPLSNDPLLAPPGASPPPLLPCSKCNAVGKSAYNCADTVFGGTPPQPQGEGYG